MPAEPDPSQPPAAHSGANPYSGDWSPSAPGEADSGLPHARARKLLRGAAAATGVLAGAMTLLGLLPTLVAVSLVFSALAFFRDEFYSPFVSEMVVMIAVFGSLTCAWWTTVVCLWVQFAALVRAVRAKHDPSVRGLAAQARIVWTLAAFAVFVVLLILGVFLLRVLPVTGSGPFLPVY